MYTMCLYVCVSLCYISYTVGHKTASLFLTIALV